LSLLLFLGPTILGLVLNAFAPAPEPEPGPTGTDPTITIPAPTGLPPLPDPSTREQQRAYVFDNTLYNQTLSDTVGCTIGNLSVASATPAELEGYLNTYVDCLMETWSGPVTNAGFELPRPTVTVYTEPITTKCGKAETENAFYCGADQQMYLALDLVDLFPRLEDQRYMVEAIIAHEFGHAVQARTGILLAEYRYEDEASTTAEADQWSRRTELQADCFAGLSLHSIAASTGMTPDDSTNIDRLFTILGDSEPNGDHGQSVNRVRWVNAGLGSNTPGQCETFSVPANEVE
jgi:predicted metalloprotease